MLLLAATTDKLQLVTSAAVTVDVHASFVDRDTSNVITPGKQNTAITTATTTDIVAAPAANTVRNIQTLTIRNRGAAAQDVTVVFDQNGTDYELHKATLLAGQALIWLDGVGFVVIGACPVPRNQSTADQAVGASTTAALTGSALALAGVAIGTRLRWLIGMTKTAAGTAAMSFDVRFGTNGNSSDTSRLTFTGGTQTAAADAAGIGIEVLVRGPISSSCVVHGKMTLDHDLDATGFESKAHAVKQAASAAFDITTAGIQASLSITTGASHSFTIQQVVADRENP